MINSELCQTIGSRTDVLLDGRWIHQRFEVFGVSVRLVLYSQTKMNPIITLTLNDFVSTCVCYHAVRTAPRVAN